VATSRRGVPCLSERLTGATRATSLLFSSDIMLEPDSATASKKTEVPSLLAQVKLSRGAGE